MTSKPNEKFSKLDFYYGEPLIKLGNVEILKNATPTSDFIHCGTPFHYSMNVKNEEINQYNEKYLPHCASLPQESFDNFAEG